MVSVNRLRRRVSDFPVGEWMLDSGAFTALFTHGRFSESVEEHATQVRRWSTCGTLLAAVAQDFMCEPFILARTGGTVESHQAATTARYLALRPLCPGIYIMPVLQGFGPAEYVRHVRVYGGELARGAWVGVGSVCKRNGNPASIRAVLSAIKGERPDLRLHGFGLKTTALADGVIRQLLDSADSMAWSFAARREGRNANDWREALAFTDRCQREPDQGALNFWGGVAA